MWCRIRACCDIFGPWSDYVSESEEKLCLNMDYYRKFCSWFSLDVHVGLDDCCNRQQYQWVSVSIKLIDYSEGCFTKGVAPDQSTRWSLLIPVYLLCGLMLTRTMHVLIMIFVVLFCMPFYCIPDTCWCRKKLAIKGSGTSKVVLEWLETQKWTLKNVKDFEDFALIVKLRAEN